METRLDVFVSSKMQELADERNLLYDLIPTLSKGLITLHAWVFEKNAPASESTIQDVYLEVLKESALYIGIFWNEYGEWTINEFNHATEWGIDRHIYVKDVDADKRDPRLTEFLNKHGDVESGITAKWFKTEDELRDAVKLSLARWVEEKLTRRSGDISATLARTADEMPHLPRNLIGREDLLTQIHEKLDAGEHVLLRGFSGMGKTVLAATAAAARIPEHGTVLWLKTGSESVDALFEALARPFNAQQSIASAADKTSAMRSLLVDTGIKLLVLDDVWDGRAFKQVMNAVPNSMTVLATSRHTYGFDGDILKVGELTPDKALETLGHYAHMDYAGNADAAELCKVLGYHAYALEIAGRTIHAERDAHSATLPPGDLLRRIQDAPDKMTLPGEFAEPGRESVAKLLDVSVDALDEESKAVFLAMGAFFAPQMTAEMLALYMATEITPEQIAKARIVISQAEASDVELISRMRKRALKKTVVTTPIEEHLGTLVQRGLVEEIRKTENSAGHYRLHDLAYSYVRAQNSDENRHRALDACLNYTWRYNQPSLENFAALRPELDNLMAAATWAMLMERYEDAERFAWNLWAESAFLSRQGLHVQEITLLEQAALVAEKQGNKLALGAQLGNLGMAYRSLGRYWEAIEKFEQGLAIQREIGDRRGQGNQLSNLGMAYRNLGRY